MTERFIYLSGGITGLTYEQSVAWREEVSVMLAGWSGGAIRTFSPMRGKRYLKDGKPIDRFNDHRHELLRAD